MKTLIVSTIAATLLVTTGAFASESQNQRDLENIGSRHGLVTERVDRTSGPDASLQQTRDYVSRAFINAKSAQTITADASSKDYGFSFGNITIAPESHK